MPAVSIEALIQLGVSAAIAIYLVVWLTRGLNGKLDRLGRALERNTKAAERTAHSMEKLFAMLEKDIEDQSPPSRA
jgi:hypothetical protein